MDDTHIHGILLRSILDRMEIVDLVTQIAVATDMRDWPALRQCFADQIDIDDSMLYGDVRASLSVDQAIARWRQVLGAFVATQHSLTNYTLTVDGDAATCLASVIIQHALHVTATDAQWLVGGYYTYGLVRGMQGWKAQQRTLALLWQRGARIRATP